MTSDNNQPQRVTIQHDELAPIQIIDRLRSPRYIRVRLKSGLGLNCKYLVHWIRVKPENIVTPEGTHAIRRGERNIGCIVIAMDFQGSEILGRSIHGLNLKQWVALLGRLGVYDNVLQRLGLTDDEKEKVIWRTEPVSQRYFYRNQLLPSNWKLCRIAEENPRLKILSLSLSELVARAGSTSAGAQLILPKSASEGAVASSPAPE